MIGFIIAAGNQTRFTPKIPKCMMPYNNSDTLTINIQTMLEICDDIYVITAKWNYRTIANNVINKFPYHSNIEVNIIDSGKGCGHAVFNALSFANFNNDSCIIKWGDAIHDSIEYYDFIKKCDQSSDIIIPCEFIFNPYTSVIADDTFEIKDILIRDEVPKNKYGFHDLSIFYIPKLSSFLNKVPMKFFDIENIFLKSILEMDIKRKLYISMLNSKSYNTIEEFKKL